MSSSKSGTDPWSAMFDKLYDSDTGEQREEVFLPIRPEGPITGAVWDNGKWVHVGKKRKRFAMDATDTSAEVSHVNVVTNPRKRARFHMKVEQSEIESLSRLVKRCKPPRHVNPVCLIQADALRRQTQMASAKSKKKKKSSATVDTPDADSYSLVPSMDSALDILSAAGSFAVPQTFADLPLSQYTKHELQRRGFVYLTDIQKAAIPHALVGRDVLGAARTGSGKTLAFVIPVLENLYRKAWHRHLGLGALILAPTRELALQIFDTLRLVGKRLRHLSCGLLIGGKHSRIEKERRVVGKMSILVGTPGRVLNHLENTASLRADDLQVLVLDEADLMLDIGLLSQVTKIVEFLPQKKRQTLLFSATLTPEIVKLTRVSLRRPIFIPVHVKPVAGGKGMSEVLPKELLQTYVLTKLEDKLNLLYTFMQTHVNDKMIVFFATLRQVKFVRRVLLKLRPYSSVVCLHSQMAQSSRMDQYSRFSALRSRGILLATEVAARGLDFPNVDWVLNFDVPSQLKAYVHRVGRAARLGQRGNSITFLCQTELRFVKVLHAAFGIRLKKLGIKASTLTGQRPVIEEIKKMVCMEPRMDALARKAYLSYLAFYTEHYNADYMDPKRIDRDALARMFGLQYTPESKKRLKRCKAGQLKDIPTALLRLMTDTRKKKKQKQKSAKVRAAASEQLPAEHSTDQLTQSLMAAARNAAANLGSGEVKTADVRKYQSRMIVSEQKTDAKDDSDEEIDTVDTDKSWLNDELDFSGDDYDNDLEFAAASAISQRDF